MPPNPPSNAHGEAKRHANSQIWKKKFLAPPPLPNPGDAPDIYIHLSDIIQKVSWFSSKNIWYFALYYEFQ